MSLLAVAWLVTLGAAQAPAIQTAPRNAQKPTCAPIAQRTSDVGCWIITDEPVGKLPHGPVFWHVDTFPTRPAAEAAKRQGGAVIDSLGKVWLMTIADEAFRAGSGDHVTDIGPLPVNEDSEYAATYMEAIFRPGMESATHTHSGPEAWYTVAGETCLETPRRRDGRPRRRPSRHRSCRSANASHCDRLHDPPRCRVDFARPLAAADDGDRCMEAEGLV